MVKRRKVLIGTGSLLAGAAAATGTGALDAMKADRNATGKIVGDNSAYMGLRASNPEKEPFVSIEDGQLKLDFSVAAGDGGTGLNQDSVNHFDYVFDVTAQDDYGGRFNLYFTSKNSDVLRFYWGGNPGDSAMGEGNSKVIASGNAGPDKRSIGVTIDLNDVERNGNILGADDDFTIHAEDNYNHSFQ